MNLNPHFNNTLPTHNPSPPFPGSLRYACYLEIPLLKSNAIIIFAGSQGRSRRPTQRPAAAPMSQPSDEFDRPSLPLPSGRNQPRIILHPTKREIKGDASWGDGISPHLTHRLGVASEHLRRPKPEPHPNPGPGERAQVQPPWRAARSDGAGGGGAVAHSPSRPPRAPTHAFAWRPPRRFQIWGMRRRRRLRMDASSPRAACFPLLCLLDVLGRWEGRGCQDGRREMATGRSGRIGTVRTADSPAAWAIFECQRVGYRLRRVGCPRGSGI